MTVRATSLPAFQDAQPAFLAICLSVSGAVTSRLIGCQWCQYVFQLCCSSHARACTYACRAAEGKGVDCSKYPSAWPPCDLAMDGRCGLSKPELGLAARHDNTHLAVQVPG